MTLSTSDRRGVSSTLVEGAPMGGDQTSDRARQETGRTRRGGPVRGREAQHRTGRGDDVTGDRRDAEEEAAEEVDARLPPAGGAAHGPPAPASRRAVGD